MYHSKPLMIYIFADHRFHISLPPTGLRTVGLILPENSNITHGLHRHINQDVLVALLLESYEIDDRTLIAMIQNHYSYEAIPFSCFFTRNNVSLKVETAV